ncbi:unnamed protein product [Pleuronectes platessa]|uniref:Uncharacterized protein n=1 Tax=Pleuronectes platessa TaxID=8262 RepID=A0A9N7TJW9_PLEPL|nr:unnamed protein product [Pleuronectes platessa]
MDRLKGTYVVLNCDGLVEMETDSGGNWVEGYWGGLKGRKEGRKEGRVDECDDKTGQKCVEGEREGQMGKGGYGRGTGTEEVQAGCITADTLLLLGRQSQYQETPATGSTIHIRGGREGGREGVIGERKENVECSCAIVEGCCCCASSSSNCSPCSDCGAALGRQASAHLTLVQNDMKETFPTVTGQNVCYEKAKQKPAGENNFHTNKLHFSSSMSECGQHHIQRSDRRFDPCDNMVILCLQHHTGR